MNSEIERESRPGAELPPCPYCGTAGPSSAGGDLRWIVACIGCPERVMGRTQDAAENAWRRRSGAQALNRL
jgi:hypothetical protein